MRNIWDRLLGVLRQPEVIGAIAIVLFGLVSEFAPALQPFLTVEVLVGLLMMLLGVSGSRYVANRLRG